MLTCRFPRVPGQLKRHVISSLRACVVAAIPVEKSDQSHKWRITMLTAEVDLLGEERFVVMPRRGLNSVVVGRVALHDDARPWTASTSTSGNLRQETKRSFSRTKIGQMQTCICVDDADAGHARQIEALGNHLRADDDVSLSALDLSQQRVRPLGASDSVLIPAQDPRGGKQPPGLRFDSLCPGAEIVERATAGGATATPGLAVVTAMTKQGAHGPGDRRAEYRSTGNVETDRMTGRAPRWPVHGGSTTG